MKCPDCEGKVSSKAQACPHCGCPIEVNTQKPVRDGAPQKKQKSKEQKKAEFRSQILSEYLGYGFNADSSFGSVLDKLSLDVPIVEQLPFREPQPFSWKNIFKSSYDVAREWDSMREPDLDDAIEHMKETIEWWWNNDLSVCKSNCKSVDTFLKKWEDSEGYDYYGNKKGDEKKLRNWIFGEKVTVDELIDKWSDILFSRPKKKKAKASTENNNVSQNEQLKQLTAVQRASFAQRQIDNNMDSFF